MELYVLNTNFEMLGIIDKYECLVWERNYYKSSSFSMQIIPDLEQFELLKKGNILLKKDNTKEAMYIDHRELEETEEGVEKLVVNGYSLEKWFDRRITLYKQLQSGNAETVIRSYINVNCINPQNSNRKIESLIQGTNNNLGQQINYSSHYKPLLEEIEAISLANGLGFKIDLDLTNQEYIFEVYEGLDRTANQSLNSRAIFSSSFENVTNQKYVDSDNDYKNYVLVAGAGEDRERKLIELGADAKGLDRLELFVDARDISDTKTSGDTEVSIPIEEYNKLLQARGIEKLSEHSKVRTFDCYLLNVNSLIYRVDYDLGDKITIINNKWGLVLNERITSIVETYDVEGLNVEIKIGNNVPSLIEKIKRKVRR